MNKILNTFTFITGMASIIALILTIFLYMPIAGIVLIVVLPLAIIPYISKKNITEIHNKIIKELCMVIWRNNKKMDNIIARNDIELAFNVNFPRDKYKEIAPNINGVLAKITVVEKIHYTVYHNRWLDDGYKTATLEKLFKIIDELTEERDLFV